MVGIRPGGGPCERGRAPHGRTIRSVPRFRTLVPPTLLAAAAALAGACQAPAPPSQGEVAGTPDPVVAAVPAEPVSEPPPSSVSAVASAEGLGAFPVSRVVLGGGLIVEDLRIGDGPLCEGPDATIAVHYRGSLAATGEVFDATEPGEAVELPLGKLIKGWKQGVPGMRVGGVRRLTIPAALAYGDRGLVQGGQVVIPPQADLVFEIELMGVR